MLLSKLCSQLSHGVYFDYIFFLLSLELIRIVCLHLFTNLSVICSQTLLQRFNYCFNLFKCIRLSTSFTFAWGNHSWSPPSPASIWPRCSLGLMHTSFPEIYFPFIFFWIPFVPPLHPLSSSSLVTSLFWWSTSSSNLLRRIDRK